VKCVAVSHELHYKLGALYSIVLQGALQSVSQSVV